MAANIGYERRKAVAEAWKSEKQHVLNGKGTRDWTQKEQREIVAKGKAKGYEGHHMKSVDGHNSRAGDPNNIQFLNRKEHLAAHSGDFHNNTNGYYNHTTGEMHSFGRNKPHIDAKDLSHPLNKKELNQAKKLETQSIAKEKAQSMEARKVKKTSLAQTGESKTLTKQRGGEVSAERATRVQSKTLSNQRSTTPASTTPSKSKKQGQSH